MNEDAIEACAKRASPTQAGRNATDSARFQHQFIVTEVYSKPYNSRYSYAA
jgi:hypothetical protein